MRARDRAGGRRLWRLIAWAAMALLLQVAAAAAQTPVKRTILALYDRTGEGDIPFTRIHRLAEFPLNQLGLVVRYHDINQPLPPVEDLGDVRGVLTWFDTNELAEPYAYLAWAEDMMDAGARFVIIQELAPEVDKQGQQISVDVFNRFLGRIGLYYTGSWNTVTYNVRPVVLDREMVEFERGLPAALPAYVGIKAVGEGARVYLRLRQNGDPETDADLIVTTDRGGYAASGYIDFRDAEETKRQWFLNPFRFFRRAFATDQLPKPDTSTLAGRRMYYSHVDGDGWRNLTRIESYSKKAPMMSAEVLLREVFKPYDDLPVTVGPIVGDLDPAWYGGKEEMEIARKILSLPNVEAGSHTYSHPFEWGFFADGRPEKEAPFLSMYPPRKDEIGRSWLRDLLSPEKKTQMGQREASPLYKQEIKRAAARREEVQQKKELHEEYETPRAYAIEPFDLNLEIKGSIDFINRLLPAGKRTMIMQWSGNTLPFEAAVRATREAGVRNINGGDTRFDREFPSYAWVAPIGRQVGNEWQIYSSNSNENTYTDLWTDRFFGFRYLVRTVRATETPYRVKPFNVYYHMYSGERAASLAALKRNLDFARTQEIVPVTTSHFSGIATGFYSTGFVSLGPQRWRIENRGELQTIRFDQATLRAVDFERSKGVLGARHYQGSLYVALDRASPAPVIALRPYEAVDTDPPAPRPYLIESRWDIWGLALEPGGFAFNMQGFGAGEMTWWVPRPGAYAVEVREGNDVLERTEAAAGADRRLRIALPKPPFSPLSVSIRQR